MDPNDFLLGGGGKSAKFENIGDQVTGVICSKPELRQQTDIKDGKPQVWDNGDPKMQLVVQLQTEQRLDDEDDGIRNLYVSGGFKRMSLQRAIAEAIRAAGAKGLEVGGRLSVAFTGEEPSATRGYNPAKLYAAKYEPPAAGFFDTPGGGPAAAPAKADDWRDAPF